MENLTRNNYEIWFIDYLDGQLSDEQLEILLDFLELNPDLKEELCGVSGVSLAASAETLDQKELLLKNQSDIPGIAAINQLCIARMENDLSEEEARQFDIRLAKDPELEKQYAAFRLTRLNPADSVIYPYKKDLLRKTRTLSPWIITAISSAAVVLLAWFLWPDTQEKITPDLAKVEKPVTSKQQIATSNQQPKTVNPQTTADSKPLLAGNRQPVTVNHKPAGKLKPDPASGIQREVAPMNSLSHRPAVAGPRIPDPQRTKILFASNYPSFRNTPVPDPDVLTLPQYALQLFREKILGEDRSLVRKTRFSLWEVAGAGVNKINDLAGTEMKLNREYDSKGDILAVSFNSRLIDVESPIKGQ